MKKIMCLMIGIVTIFFGMSISPTTISIALKNHSSVINQLNENILYVGGNGSGNFTKIQDAIDNASVGDIVFVFNESSPYYEHINVDKTIDLRGENRDTTVINGNKIGSVVTISANNVTITGFTVERSGDDYWNEDSGVRVLSNGNTIADTNSIFNYFGIFLSSCNGNTIVNNNVKYNEYGIRLVDSSTDNLISGNTLISWSFGFNIYLRKTCNNNTISNNILKNSDGYGIYIYESDDNIFSNNTLIDCEYGILLYYSNSSEIISNFFQNEKDGLSLSRSTGNIVSQNIFVDDGLFIYDSYKNVVTDNTVNGKPLIYLEDISDHTITGDPGQILLINCENILVQGKDISDTNVAIELWGSKNCLISQNTLSWNRRDIYLHDADFNGIKDNILKINKGIIFMQTLEIKNCQGNEIVRNSFSITHDFAYIIIDESQENLFSKNTITSDSEEICGRLILTDANKNIVKENIFNSGAIRLSLSDCNTINYNIFNNGCLVIDWSMRNKISGNHIIANFNVCGIPMEDSFENIICGNTIENCKGAFYLSGSLRNVIKKNNIINCGKIPALFSNSLFNRWWRNYWGQQLYRPKIIPGEIRISRYYLPDIVIPVFNVDLFPRQIPYLLDE